MFVYGDVCIRTFTKIVSGSGHPCVGLDLHTYWEVDDARAVDLAGDTAPFADLLADDFCYVDIFGEIRDRAGYLAPCWARSPPALSP